MKRIKINEKQAKLLGLTPIKENSEETGLKSVGGALGPKPIRIVISGDSIARLKDFIIKRIQFQDPTTTVEFYPQTNKIVGNVSEYKFASIVRDVKNFDPLLKVEKKPLAKALKEGSKNIVKITKEQYNRIFANNALLEGFDKTDMTFKKEFKSKDIENLSAVSESDFNIAAKNTELPSSIQGRFGKDIKTESNSDDEFSNEVKELIKYLYRKSDKFSPYWEKNGLTYDDICDALASKNLIVSSNGRYELSKTSASNPKEAIQKVEVELKNLLPQEQTLEQGVETEINEKEPMYSKPIKPREKSLSVVANNNEIAVLKDSKGTLYVFYHNMLNNNELAQYASREMTYVGKDDEGEPDFDFDNDFEVDDSVIEAYVNDNLNSLSKGVGLEAYESGVDLVQIDDNLKNELIGLYDKDKNIVSALSSVSETTGAASSGAFTGPMSGGAVIKKEMPNTPVVSEVKPTELGKGYTHFAIQKSDNKIVNGWDYKSLYDKDEKKYDMDSIKEYSKGDLIDMFPDRKPAEFKIVTRKFLEQNGVDPSNSENWFKFDINETTSTQSAGNYQYAANALPGINRDGSFKKTSKTPAQTKTQYSGGSFVDFNDCTKMNNKPAGSGCSKGAVDGVVKLSKTKSNISAPSLKEGKR